METSPTRCAAGFLILSVHNVHVMITFNGVTTVVFSPIRTGQYGPRNHSSDECCISWLCLDVTNRRAQRLGLCTSHAAIERYVCTCEQQVPLLYNGHKKWMRISIYRRDCPTYARGFGNFVIFEQAGLDKGSAGVEKQICRVRVLPAVKHHNLPNLCKGKGVTPIPPPRPAK